VGGVRKFFLEAKKPSTAVKGDVGPAYQLRRYAWSAKLPISILTDFEEFAVYDCRRRPKPADNAGVARILYLTFDRYVEDTKRKRGTSEVDVEFLQLLGYRRKWYDEHDPEKHAKGKRQGLPFSGR